MTRFDFFASGEARRMFREGELRNAMLALDLAYKGPPPRIVTYGDWVRATGYRGYAPGECVEYDPRDGLPTYR